MKRGEVAVDGGGGAVMSPRGAGGAVRGRGREYK